MDKAKVVGSGTFGTVFKTYIPETEETVAVKKASQDPNFKNRELGVLLLLRDIRDHPNVVELKHHYEKPRGGATSTYIW